MRALAPDALEHSAWRIERWLLESGVQLADGPQQGGVAGWLDKEGRAEFVYLEITGYYLTAMAWLAGGAASSEERAAAALDAGNSALEWMRAATANGEVPPTRLYLAPGRDDWRNAAIFCFDLAMAARGVASFGEVVGSAEADDLVRTLVARVHEVCGGSDALRSHLLRNGLNVLPDRWSTRPGPHHTKAAAALLRLPPDVLDPALALACHRTAADGADAMQPPWPCREMHPLLYGLEGLLMLDPGGSESMLDVAEQAYGNLLQHQAADGALPAAVTPSAEVRADVLAQALRVGALLRAAGGLREERWPGRLDALASALLRHVREDGGVAFRADEEIANAWCAMFAHQALLLHSRVSRGELSTHGENWSPSDAAERLI